MGHAVLPEQVTGPQKLEVVSHISLWGLGAVGAGDAVRTILGWDQLHGCSASFTGVCTVWEDDMARNETGAVRKP